MINKHHSRCPVVRRSTETFWQWVEIGGERAEQSFEREVLWLLRGHLEPQSVTEHVVWSSHCDPLDGLDEVAEKARVAAARTWIAEAEAPAEGGR
jgi:hypothetical protein